MKSNTISYQSSKIFYRSIGKGKPVILIHGFAEDGDIWKNQIAFLKDHFYLIIPDLPGSGKSEIIKDMSIEGMADVIKAILSCELQKSPPNLSPSNRDGLEEFSLVGHSMGGYISLALAEKYPDQLSSLALVHSSAFADSEEKKANRLKSIEFIKKNGAYEFLRAVIIDLFSESWSTNNNKQVEQQVEKSRSFTNEAVIQYYQALISRPDRTLILKTASYPVIFIIGEHDKAVPFDQSMQQCYLPQIAHIHILRHSAHMGMLEEAEKVNQALLQLK